MRQALVRPMRERTWLKINPEREPEATTAGQYTRIRVTAPAFATAYCLSGVLKTTGQQNCPAEFRYDDALEDGSRCAELG